MADLIAQGTDTTNRWRRTLSIDTSYDLGRTAEFPVPWDPQVSRQHATLRSDGRELRVSRCENARNPIFFQGQPSDSFSIRPGEHFVIGSTTFTLSDEQIHVTQDAPNPMTEQAYRAQYLRQVHYRDADKRINVLGQLPEIIATANSDTELFVQLANVLLALTAPVPSQFFRLNQLPVLTGDADSPSAIAMDAIDDFLVD